MQQLTLIAPDDWHLHLRDGDMLHETVAATSRCFKRAIVMPNLAEPITDADKAMAYRRRIINAIPDADQFDPLMTLYLTNQTSAKTILDAKKAGIKAVKYYPAGATTLSDAAVKNIQALYPVLETMSEQGMILLIHGEVTESDVDIFDREALFIETILKKIISSFPDLKIVLEHITTFDAVKFIEASADTIAATITPQHLLMNRNDLLVGGIKPHNYCLPILKRGEHQKALQAAVASGNPKFFLGSDSAPHEKQNKESDCGCAGCYSSLAAIELYAEIFEQLNILDKLENFASRFGAEFYQLPINQTQITLIRKAWRVPREIILASGARLVPFYAGQALNWQLASDKTNV